MDTQTPDGEPGNVLRDELDNPRSANTNDLHAALNSVLLRLELIDERLDDIVTMQRLNRLEMASHDQELRGMDARLTELEDA